MSQTTTLPPLEDDFCDVLGKAARGRGADAAALARAADATEDAVRAWLAGEATPDASAFAGLAACLELSAERLAASAARAWHPRTAVPENVLRYDQAPQNSNGYVLFASDGSCAVVDPAGGALDRLRDAKIAPERIRHILITHRHADHCDAADALHALAPHATLRMHPLERAAADMTAPCEPTAGGAAYPFGDSVIRAFVIPGHTDGLTVFAFDGALCVGDLFFAGSVGRTFGPHTTYETHLANIRRHVFTMNPDMVVLPGHGPATTIALERAHNPFFS